MGLSRSEKVAEFAQCVALVSRSQTLTLVRVWLRETSVAP